ncbi:hypothetical protein DFP72DRAFT_1118638 [Ephemerocybe angulata]|uniref:Nucleoside diphosphate kinase n=1 Tax=Ephemerocybe angulata TaxID=980116 RepID=A0A8H6M4Y1_9AGAR|nr:hypothetical protein DFP72DRAFT_1118638 [Tulosesus angulatus]
MDESVVYYDGDQERDEAAVLEQLANSVSSPNTPITRTHRFDIERRIQDASFEIVKERQMEFDTETDPETLEELFGEDTYSLADRDRGPVWVYILERRRAVEVWHALMDPSSLRAVYGLSAMQNALMGSEDEEIAEVQIASLFVSSPPFPTTDLPAENGEGKYDAMHAVTNPSTINGSSSRLNANGKPAFRARAAPSSAAKPDIVPRMTKAAALRTGQPIEKTASSPRRPVTKERLAETFANVPGHKRSTTISVASTAAPTIAPKMTRAASLRLGITPAPAPMRRRSLTTDDAERKNTFEGVPGHKRRESIAVSSIKAPTVAPRLNKSASLRTQPKQAPPTSFMFKGATAPKTPGSLSRANSSDNLSPGRASRPASQASSNQPTVTAPAPTPRRPAPRPSSVIAPRPSSVTAPRPPISRRTSSVASATPPTAKPKVNGADATSDPEQAPATPAPAKARPRPSSVCSAPSIAPRTNKSAALRAAKKEAEALAAAAAACEKGWEGFKTIAT